MGGIAISRIYSETNNGKMQIYEKRVRMDVGRPELLTRADLISNALMLELLRRFPLLKIYIELIKFLKVLGMVDNGVFSSKDGRLMKHHYHTKKQNYKVLISRSHAGNISRVMENEFRGENPAYYIEPAGLPSRKYLDLYVHITAIKKWDICACDAIAKAAGGALLSLGDGLPVDYSVKFNEHFGKSGENIKFDPIHKDGILMALDAPYSSYERLKRLL
uniref:inositol-phosphate phosphatase n=1 Tax=Meloidogyne hapla TaxID=6305 RepID=A0A1I8BYA2_MELHA